MHTHIYIYISAGPCLSGASGCECREQVCCLLFCSSVCCLLFCSLLQSAAICYQLFWGCQTALVPLSPRGGSGFWIPPGTMQKHIENQASVLIPKSTPRDPKWQPKGVPKSSKSMKNRVWKRGVKKIAKKCENREPRTPTKQTKV